MHGSVIEARPLVANADLTRLFVSAMMAWMEGGWRIGEFSSTSATFFCDRGSERRMVSIDPSDPYDVPMYGGAHISGRDEAFD